MSTLVVLSVHEKVGGLILWIEQSRVVDPTSLCVEGCPSRSKLRIVFSYGPGLWVYLSFYNGMELQKCARKDRGSWQTTLKFVHRHPNFESTWASYKPSWG